MGIKYLIKFVSKLEYAESLVNGTLFMRPANYYHNLEIGQGDHSEASVFDGVCIYKNSQLPIYCLYSVEDKDIFENKTFISKHCITDFHCENGYAVIIDFDTFENCLKSNFQNNLYSVYGGSVGYGKKSKDFSSRIMIENTAEHLFIKPAYFSYQKEYRVVVHKNVENSQNSVKYIFNEPLIGCSIIKISDLEIQDDNYIVELKRGN